MLVYGVSVRFPKGFIKLFLVTFFVSLFITFAATVTYADTMGPSFSQVYPEDGRTVNQTKIVISLIAHDTDIIDYGSLLMKVDGVVVKPTAQFAPIDESTDDLTTLEIYYPVALTPGTHTAYVYIKDRSNNASSLSWTFRATDPPKILTLTPANGATVVTRMPAISAAVSGESIDPDSIVMTLNNSPVQAVFDQVYSTISYTPEQPLTNEVFHNVSLNFKDSAGRSVSATWQFYVNTFQEMTYSVDDQTCQKCHNRTVHSMQNCSKCHGVNQSATQPVYPVDDCYFCHYGDQNYPTGYHVNGLPLENPEPHPVQVTYSCLDCHDRSWAATQVPSIHNVFNTAVEHTTTTTGCTNCHSSSLTREHLRRFDNQGNQLTCFTCHNNPDPEVKNAILFVDSSCGACHSATHPEHDNGLDQHCQTCHGATLLQEPQFHVKNDCSLCHENTTNPYVGYAIAADDTSCFACHKEGHNVKFLQKVPTDIPIYPGFEWSLPQETAPWVDEPWFPAEFKEIGSKMLITNHRTDLNGDQIFNWYTQQMTANGWEKVSGPVQGSDFFELSYRKGTRKANINVYTGTTHDPSADFVGYRIELIYR